MSEKINSDRKIKYLNLRNIIQTPSQPIRRGFGRRTNPLKFLPGYQGVWRRLSKPGRLSICSTVTFRGLKERIEKIERCC
jgi:hypothetical protein